MSVVSVIIISYNVSDLLRACLKSVHAQGVDCEVIVVDNASSDDSVAMVRSAFPHVKLINNKSNVGFSAANNQGMEHATGEYILLLNPDTEIRNGALQKLLSFARQQDSPGLIGPRLVNSDGSLQPSAWKKPSPWDMIFEALFLHLVFRTSEYSNKKFQQQFEPGMLSGAALLFPRKLYEDIGGLDPRLFWMEDADFATRVRKAGGKVIYYPGAEIVHHSGKSSQKNLTLVISNQLISKLKYYVKHNGILTMMFVSVFCFSHIISRLLIFAVLSPFGALFRAKARAYLGAIPRFLGYLFLARQNVS